MGIRNSYNHTLIACYIGYVTQAIINNFAPLLFLTFQRSYQISLDRITMLVSINFAVQLLVDLLSARYVDRIGYRSAIVGGHAFSAAGLVGLALLPIEWYSVVIGFIVLLLVLEVLVLRRNAFKHLIERFEEYYMRKLDEEYSSESSKEEI